MAHLFAGLDVSTQSCKLVVIDGFRRVLTDCLKHGNDVHVFVIMAAWKNGSTIERILLAFVTHPIGGVFVDADVTLKALPVEAQFNTEEVGAVLPIPLSRMLDVHVLATVGAQFAA